MDFSNFTFRCSSLGYIMADGKGKSNLEKYNDAILKVKDAIEKFGAAKTGTKASENLALKIEKLEEVIKKLEPIKDVTYLSDSCKTHLCDVYTRVKYGRTEDIKSKYLEKGLLMEEDAITQYSLLTGLMYNKNKVRETNEFIEGEMDFEKDDMVIDTKVNWSIFQFTRVASRPIKPLYHWQLDGYMWLFGKNKGRLVYSLLDTPEHLIKMEEKRLLYDFVGSEEDYNEACIELRRNHIYSDIPIEERVRVFDVERSEERIEKIKSRVKECRIYLNNLNNKTLQDDEPEFDSDSDT